jgi:hypothetical protein
LLIYQRWIQKYGGYGPHIHNLHNNQVIRENQPSDLLVFNVKEGWTPLCKFLDVPVPTEIPFPNINDTKQIQRVFYMIRIFGVTVWAFIFLVIGLVIRIFV